MSKTSELLLNMIMNWIAHKVKKHEELDAIKLQ